MKSKLIFLMILFIVTVALIGYNLSMDATKGDNMTELTLTLSLGKPIYQNGEPIRVLIILKNTGDKAVVVNKRMTANSAAAPDSLRNISFTITGPSREIIPFAARVNVRPPTPNDFISLSPGETIEVFYDIERLYNLKNTGSYSIFAVYQNTSDPDKNKTAWMGKITSTAVVFEIIP